MNEKIVSTQTTSIAAILALYALPFPELLFRAQTVHRAHFPEMTMQLSTLLNVKDGGCAEDCHYCPQAARYQTGVKAKKLMTAEEVRGKIHAAKDAGATRFCMAAAWRELKDRDVPAIAQLIHEVKTAGMESCMTLGMITDEQAAALQAAGLDYYNHNIDTSPEYYEEVITTRTFDDRLQTLNRVRQVGMKVCCGGIVGMGESREDRAGLLATLANMDPQPESVPINQLIPIPGTPLGDTPPMDPLEFVRTVAIARILMPHTRVRLSAGRAAMSDELQTLCILAGANSIHYGEKLLVTTNVDAVRDRELLSRLGIAAEV